MLHLFHHTHNDDIMFTQNITQDHSGKGLTAQQEPLQTLWTDKNYVIRDNAGAFHVMKRQTATRRFLNKCVYIYIQDKNAHDSIKACHISNLYPYMNPISILWTNYKMKTSFCASLSSQIAGNQLFPTIIVFVLVT